jgi:hypothetical protein
MSSASQIMAGILLITVLAVEFGGLSLLAMLTRRIPGYLDNPLRQNMFRAGHAHAGVWVVFALVALLCVDQTDLAEPLKWVVRLALRWHRFSCRSGSSCRLPDPTHNGPTASSLWSMSAVSPLRLEP